MARKKIRKNHIWDQAKWEDIEEKDNNDQQERKKEWEYIKWEEGTEIHGYYIGVKRTKNNGFIGLLLKQPPFEENEPPCIAFSLPVNLRRKLEQLEKRNRLLHGVRIILTEIINLEDGRKMYNFKVQSTPELKIDEDIIMQYLSFTPEKLTGGSMV